MKRTFGKRGPPANVRATAIRMLARREYSRAELGQRLLRRGAPAIEVDGALDELQRLGLLSDARYAQALVAQMSGRYARRAIEHTMREHGVAEAARAEVEGSLAEIDDEANARAMLRRRFPDPPANDRDKARQVRFMQSRGYGLSLVLRLLRRREEIDAD